MQNMILNCINEFWGQSIYQEFLLGYELSYIK